MKNSLLLILLVPVFAFGQTFSVSPYVQHTVMGLQKGLEVVTTTQKGFGAGVFYQSTREISLKESVSNYPFTGVSLFFPIAGSCEKIAVQGSLKAGLVNEQFFALTPELITSIKLTRHLAIAVGTGFRSGEAAVSAKLNINVF